MATLRVRQIVASTIGPDDEQEPACFARLPLSALLPGDGRRPPGTVRKDRKQETMTGFKSLVLFVSFVCAAAVATPLLAQTQVHDVFKAQGANANTFLDGMSVNGVGNASAIDVFRDRSSGDTFLLVRVFDGSTVHFLGGSIPATDFAIADDLRWATLHTVINSSPWSVRRPFAGTDRRSRNRSDLVAGLVRSPRRDLALHGTHSRDDDWPLGDVPSERPAGVRSINGFIWCLRRGLVWRVEREQIDRNRSGRSLMCNAANS
jgi:hypothetical protein